MSTPEALLTEIRERRPLPFPASTRQVIIHAARAWTPSLDAPQPATLTIDDGTISSIIWGATSHAAPTPAGSLVLTLDDHVTLLPGLVDCHNHSSFANSFDFDTSAFATAASTVANLSTILASGITSIHSAASCKLGVEAALRTLVHEGRISGPRWRSAGPELTPPHGLGAGINVSPWETNCFGYVAPDIHALQAAIRECAEFGVDTIKLNISGEEMISDLDGRKDVRSTFDLDAVRATVELAHSLGMRVAAHSRGSTSIADSVHGGVDVLYHCDFADEAGRDAIIAAGDRLLLGPSLGFLVRIAPDPLGLPGDPLFDAPAKLAASLDTHHYLLKKGGEAIRDRIGIGGDYGFHITPHGDNCFDLQVYTELLGMHPVDALRCATSSGARFMGIPVGHLAEGFAGDVIACVGDPTVDVRVLRRDATSKDAAPSGVAFVMIGGRVANLEQSVLDSRHIRAEFAHARGAARSVAQSSADVIEVGWGNDERQWVDEAGVRDVLRRAYSKRFPLATAEEIEVALGTKLSERRPAAGVAKAPSSSYA